MDILKFILMPISMCFSFGLYYFHVEFWINYFNESSAKIVGISFFTIPLFPIFGIIQIFRTFKNIDGRKSSKPQWHTDPNDLPPMIQDKRHVSERVWINVENWGTEDGYYDYNKNCWIIRCRIVNLPILGWIEIPELEV